MTIKVKVTHDNPGVNRSILVNTLDGVGTRTVVDTKELKDGESADFWVHSSRDLQIEEAK